MPSSQRSRIAAQAKKVGSARLSCKRAESMLAADLRPFRSKQRVSESCQACCRRDAIDICSDPSLVVLCCAKLVGRLSCAFACPPMQLFVLERDDLAFDMRRHLVG